MQLNRSIILLTVKNLHALSLSSFVRKNIGFKVWFSMKFSLQKRDKIRKYLRMMAKGKLLQSQSTDKCTVHWGPRKLREYTHTHEDAFKFICQ